MVERGMTDADDSFHSFHPTSHPIRQMTFIAKQFGAKRYRPTSCSEMRSNDQLKIAKSLSEQCYCDDSRRLTTLSSSMSSESKLSKCASGTMFGPSDG